MKMASTNDMKNINKLHGIIVKAGAIDKFDLVMQSGLSISMYDKLKPFLERIYNHAVQYDSKTKIWKSLKEAKHENLVSVS